MGKTQEAKQMAAKKVTTRRQKRGDRYQRYSDKKGREFERQGGYEDKLPPFQSFDRDNPVLGPDKKGRYPDMGAKEATAEDKSGKIYSIYKPGSRMTPEDRVIKSRRQLPALEEMRQRMKNNPRTRETGVAETSLDLRRGPESEKALENRLFAYGTDKSKRNKSYEELRYSDEVAGMKEGRSGSANLTDLRNVQERRTYKQSAKKFKATVPKKKTTRTGFAMNQDAPNTDSKFVRRPIAPKGTVADKVDMRRQNLQQRINQNAKKRNLFK